MTKRAVDNIQWGVSPFDTCCCNLTYFVLYFCSTDHINCLQIYQKVLHIAFPAAAWRPLWQHAGEGGVGGGGALHWGGGRAVCLERETKEVGGETKGRRSAGGKVNT